MEKTKMDASKKKKIIIASSLAGGLLVAGGVSAGVAVPLVQQNAKNEEKRQKYISYRKDFLNQAMTLFYENKKSEWTPDLTQYLRDYFVPYSKQTININKNWWDVFYPFDEEFDYFNISINDIGKKNLFDLRKM